jgi:hypothetical protein
MSLQGTSGENTSAAQSDSRRKRRSSSKRLSSSRFVWQVVAASGGAPPPLEQIDMEHIVVFDGQTLSELEQFVARAAAFLHSAKALSHRQGSRPQRALDTTTPISSLEQIDVVNFGGTGAVSGGGRGERSAAQHSSQQLAVPAVIPPAGEISYRPSAHNNVSFDQPGIEDDLSRRSGLLLDGLLYAADQQEARSPVVYGRLTGDNKHLPYEFMIPIVAKSNVVSCLRTVWARADRHYFDRLRLRDTTVLFYAARERRRSSGFPS